MTILTFIHRFVTRTDDDGLFYLLFHLSLRLYGAEPAVKSITAGLN